MSWHPPPDSKSTVTLGHRIGKTNLMLKGAEETRSVYHFVSCKSEPVLYGDILQTICESRIDTLGEMERFSDFFRTRVLYFVHEPITVLIDESRTWST